MVRTINKDIELVIGADISKSTTQLRDDLKIIINKLNDVTKITFTSNLSEIRKEAEEVARLLSSLKGSAAGGIVSTGAGGGITAMTSEKAAFEYAAKMREAQINREMDLMAKEDALRQKNNAATEARNVRAEIAAHEAAERALARENKEIERNAQLSRQASVEGQASADRISSALDKYARAQNSSNAKSREAYAGLQGLQTRLDALNKDYNSGKIGPEEYRRELSLLNKEAVNLGGTLQRNGEGAITFGERLKKAFTNIGATILTTRVIMAAYRAVRQMIQASIELDTSMNQLRIVTGASADEMQRFADTTAETAKRIGASITDLASSATVFARLGYSLSESSQLAEYTTMLQNVGNISAEDAQDAVTAIVKAYNIDVSDIESVMDRLVKVGNSFPISTSQIAEGMNNASSALAAAGNNFDQSVALLTAANTTVQNAAKASTGLRTIAARLRNTKTDLDELGEEMTTAKYEAVVKALTDANVALRDTTGEYRSTYDIMKDIAAQWDKLSNTRQAALATEIAGTRQQAIFYSIINQFREASGAMDAMANSAGTLDQAYSIYLDSAQGRINQFKATFQDLAQDVIKSDWIKQVVQGATTLVEAFGKIMRAVVKLIDALGGLKVVMVGVATVAGIKLILSLFSKIKTALSILIPIIQNSVVAWKSYAAGVVTSSSAMQASIPVIGLVLAAITALVGSLILMGDTGESSAEKLSAAFEESKSKLDSAVNDLNSITERLKEARDRILELEKLPNPTFVDNEELENLREEVSLLEREADLQKERKKGAEEDARKTFVQNTQGWLNKTAEGFDVAIGLEDIWGIDAQGNVDRDASRWGKYYKTNIWDSAGNFWKNLIPFYGGLFTDTKDLKISYQQIIDETSDAMSEFRDSYSDALKSGNQDAIDTSKKNLEGFEQYLRQMLSQMATLYEGVEDLWVSNPETEAQKEFNEQLRQIMNFEDKLSILLDKTGHARVDAFQRILELYGIESEDDFWSEFEAGSDIAVDITKDLEAVGISADDVRAIFDYLAKKAEDDLETVDNAVKSLKGSLEKLSGATSGLNTLDKIFTDVANGNGFDFSSLVDSGFIETFGQFTDEFNQFIWTVTNAPDDIDACRGAFTNLAKAYLKQLGITEELNEDTQATIVAYLNQMGVQAKLIPSLENVATAKHKVLSEKIITGSDVQELINEANAASADAASIEKLLEAKRLASKIDSNPEKFPVGSQQWMAYQERIRQLVSEPLSYEKLNIEDFIGDYTGGSSYQSYLDSEAKAAEKAESAAEKSAEKAKTWFDIQLAEHKHRVQMEQETEAQYLAWLDKAYKQAYAEGIHDLDEYRKYEEEVYDGRQKLAENAKSALDKLVDYRKKMLEQEVSDQKDALKEQLDALKDFYDKQKEMLQDSFDEEDYLRDQEEKRKSVTDIELKLAQIRGDDSAAAAKRRAELNQQLKEAKEELADFERDHARDAATKLLDDEYAKQEEAINAQIDSLDEKYKSAKELYEEALRDIKSGSVSLYQEMIAWNAEYGDGIDDTITSAWENAYKALQDYKTLYGSMFGGANLANATGYRYPSGGGYASGTSWAIPGLRGIDEAGSETIFESSNGRKYKMFSGGEKVLNARASDFLYKFANGGSQLLEKFVKRVTGGVPEGIGARMQTNAIEMGDIIIQGNADKETISQIRREQRKAVDFMLREINSLSY